MKLMTRKGITNAIFALFSVTLGSSFGNATPLIWTLQNVVIADGGTASGSFVYDATTNVYSNINLSVTATASFPAAVFTFPRTVFANQSYYLAALDSNAADLTGAHELQLYYFPTTLTNAGGTVPLPVGRVSQTTEKLTCTTATCDTASILPGSFIVAGGSVTTTPTATATPEPATLALIPLGLIAIEARRRLRFYS